MSNPNEVVTVVTKATKALSAQVAAILKVTAELNTIQAAIPELADEISLKSGELAQIEVNTKEAARKAKAELNLQILENEEKVLTTLLAKQGKANISQDHLKDLEERLAYAENESKALIQEAVAEAVNKLKTEHKMAMETVVADHRVASAQLNAELSQATSQVQFFKDQVEQLQKSIDAERAARIEVAKHSQPIFQTSGNASNR